MKLLFLAAAALALSVPAVAHADDNAQVLEEASYSRAEQIRYVLDGTMQPDAVFSDSFLRAVPASQLASLTADMIRESGPLIAVDEIEYKGNGGASFDIVFEKARAEATLQIELAEPYRVTGFHIASARPLDDTPQRLLEEFSALPGTTSFGAYRIDGGEPEPILTHNAHRQLAVGSTFKLYVLSALAHEIAAGKRNWSDVTTIDEPSLPSGQMQKWAVGSPATLHTLAAMMISISDNTATDVLMRLLGREAIEAEVHAAGHSDPSATLPAFTTVEMFALKNDPARIATYMAADDAGQKALLTAWASSLKAGNADTGKLMTAGPTAIDSIEWFASNEDIARILSRLRDMGDPVVLDILGINTVLSPGESGNLEYIGYKGGSETGVLNLSWLLKDRQGHWYAVSASWNNPAAELDDNSLIALSRRLVRMLQQ